jgi:DNA primase
MSGAERYVPTKAIRDAVAGREAEVLSALGIQWNRKSGHIRCPYPDHKDEHPSWRWNRDKGRAHCTCTRSASIFDVVAKVKGVDFEGAKIAVAEMVGRSDLIRQRGGKTKATGKSKGRGGE